MSSQAAEARQAAREHPFLLDALRAGVVNYTAAAGFLGLDAEDEAVATALRRFANELPEYDTESRDVRVRMRRGVRLTDEADGAGADSESADDPVLAVGDHTVVPGGSMTAVTAEGDVDDDALAAVLSRLARRSVVVDATGVAGDTLAIVVPEPDGATALRAVEAALDAVPA